MFKAIAGCSSSSGLSQPIPSGDFAYTHLKVFHVFQDVVKDTSARLYGVDRTYAGEGIGQYDDGGGGEVENKFHLKNWGSYYNTFPNYVRREEALEH